MTSEYISRPLRERVRKQSQDRCGYCLVPQSLLYAPLEIDHIVPCSKGGLTDEVNLWLACRVCNGFKADQTFARDPESGVMVALFNPRLQNWLTDFRWSDDATEIIGPTPCGRATVIALQLNDLNSIETRRLWTTVGWHPPTEDRR